MGEIKILQIKAGDGLHGQCLELRHQVLRVPLGRSLFTEDLSKEVDDVVFVAIASIDEVANDDRRLEKSPTEKVVGCILLTNYTEDSSSRTFKIRQMAVFPEYQGQGIGGKLVQKAEEFAKQVGKKRIYLHGRKPALGFYLKLGYQIISEEFLELEIIHFALEKAIV